MTKNRVRDWQTLNDVQFRQQVASDLDELDGNLGHGLRDVRADMAALGDAHRADMAELKEQQKWILRTMWALLVGLLMVMAGIVATVVVR